MKTNSLIDEMISLHMEERARMAEALLQSLNPQDDGLSSPERDGQQSGSDDSGRTGI